MKTELRLFFEVQNQSSSDTEVLVEHDIHSISMFVYQFQFILLFSLNEVVDDNVQQYDKNTNSIAQDLETSFS